MENWNWQANDRKNGIYPPQEQEVTDQNMNAFEDEGDQLMVEGASPL